MPKLTCRCRSRSVRSCKRPPQPISSSTPVPGERSIDPQLVLRGQIFLRRVTVSGERGYVNTRQRPNQEIDVRARHVDEMLTAAAEVAVTPELTVKAAGHRLSTRYDDAAEFDGTAPAAHAQP